MNIANAIAGATTRQKVIFQLSLWTMVFVVYSFILIYIENYQSILIINSINVPLFMLGYYVLRYVQIPLLYFKQKYISFFTSIVFMGLFLYAFHAWLWLGVINKGYTTQDILSSFDIQSLLIKALRFYSPAFVLIVIEYYYKRQKETDRLAALEKEKINTELQFLKAQINPHFLFNTLNNLYSYVVTDSPNAADLVLRLTHILEYVLNRSQESTVPLQEEVSTIKNFLELEQIRYGDRLDVNLIAEGDLSQPISPLILLSIVENAFKHGASGDIENPKIDIQIKASASSIQCKVWNTKNQSKGEINDGYKEGIGLKNLKRQLSLVYNNRHDLVIENQKDSFCILLTLKSVL